MGLRSMRSSGHHQSFVPSLSPSKPMVFPSHPGPLQMSLAQTLSSDLGFGYRSSRGAHRQRRRPSWRVRCGQVAGKTPKPSFAGFLTFSLPCQSPARCHPGQLLPGAALGAATQDGYVFRCKSLGREAVLRGHRDGGRGWLGDGGLMVPVEPQPSCLE